MMAEKYFDIGAGIKFAVSQISNMEMLKLGALYAVLAVIPSYLMAMMYGNEYAYGTQVNVANAGAMLLIGAVMILFGLFNFFYVLPRLMRAAIKANGMDVPQKVPGVIEWLMLHIRLFVVDITCWYDKKLLLPALVLLVLAVASIIVSPEIGIVVLLIAIFAWIIGVIIHGIRTTFAQYLLLRGDGNEGQMPRKSFDTIKGQTVEVFIPQLIFGVLAFAVAMGIAFAALFTSQIPIAGTTIRYAITFVIEALLLTAGTAYAANMFKFFCTGQAKHAPAPAAAVHKKAIAKKKGGKKK